MSEKNKNNKKELIGSLIKNYNRSDCKKIKDLLEKAYMTGFVHGQSSMMDIYGKNNIESKRK